MGLTGLWWNASAITGHKPFDWMTLDRYYISSWSVWLDITLLIKVLRRLGQRWVTYAELSPTGGYVTFGDSISRRAA
jgi:lipopolysaccharide/colanic/teichoic acid biosynthesis glycosyltransferase